MIRYKAIRDKKLCVFNNIFINGDIAVAYYVLFPFNYKIMDLKSAERRIEKIYNSCYGLYNTFGEAKISLFKLKNIVSKKEVIESIVNTVKIYDKNYAGFPEEYRDYLKHITNDYSILSITLNTKSGISIEDHSLKFIIKNLFDDFIKNNFSTRITPINEELLVSQNSKIKNTLQSLAVPANPKLVMNIYINTVFPSYNLVYNDFLMQHQEPILAGVKQEITPHFGWFEMSNSGISAFGGIPRITYGSVLKILEFPESIMSENFNMNVPGLRVNIKMLEKEKARVKFKRIRAETTEEQEQALEAEAKDVYLNEDLKLVDRAIQSLDRGRVLSEVCANILVLSDTKEELESKKRKIITELSNSKVICSIASNQAKEYVDSFIKNSPSQYNHIMDLQYALSFQIDHGVLVGDQDSKFGTPVIGIS